MSARAKVVELPGLRGPAKVVTEHREEERPLRPAQCREYMRRTLAREFRGIVDGFVEGAKSGSCQHVKLATELLESKAKPSKERAIPSGRKTLRRLITKMEQMGH